MLAKPIFKWLVLEKKKKTPNHYKAADSNRWLCGGNKYWRKCFALFSFSFLIFIFPLLLFTSSCQLFQFSYFRPNCISKLLQPDSFHLAEFPGSVLLLRVSWIHTSMFFPGQHDQPPSVSHQEWKELVTFCEPFLSWVVLSSPALTDTALTRSGLGKDCLLSSPRPTDATDV